MYESTLDVFNEAIAMDAEDMADDIAEYGSIIDFIEDFPDIDDGLRDVNATTKDYEFSLKMGDNEISKRMELYRQRGYDEEEDE